MFRSVDKVSLTDETQRFQHAQSEELKLATGTLFPILQPYQFMQQNHNVIQEVDLRAISVEKPSHDWPAVR